MMCNHRSVRTAKAFLLGFSGFMEWSFFLPLFRPGKNQIIGLLKPAGDGFIFGLRFQNDGNDFELVIDQPQVDLTYLEYFLLFAKSNQTITSQIIHNE